MEVFCATRRHQKTKKNETQTKVRMALRSTKMGGEVSRFSASMIKLIWNSMQTLQLLQPLSPDRCDVLISSPPPAPLPTTKSLFLLMTNQNQTSPAPYSQNQLPDSGSVRESQRQQFWLSLHRSHRVRLCVWNVLCLSPKERSGAIDISSRLKIFVTAVISKSWVKILPRGHISGYLKFLEDFFCEHLYL